MIAGHEKIVKTLLLKCSRCVGTGLEVAHYLYTYMGYGDFSDEFIDSHFKIFEWKSCFRCKGECEVCAFCRKSSQECDCGV